MSQINSKTSLELPVGYQSTKDASILVTGSSGFVGARLVEMLLERGAKRVVCLDVVPPNDELLQRFRKAGNMNSSGTFEIIVETITNREAVVDACSGVDVVYHIAALVGPFHDRAKYEAVNYYGTIHVLEGCKAHRVPRLVFSSSPSTRFTGCDITGQREEELPFPNKFMALYAETKARAEQAVSAAADDTLDTISVAPHQVYGPHDTLFLPNLLETAGNGRLRIFGKGENKISVCYVDNYCHGLMCGADSLLRHNSPTRGKFYIITDEEPQLFWHMINQAVVAMGFTDLFHKVHLPVWFLLGLSYLCNFVGFLINKKFKLNPFNVKMLTIHRYFSPENSRQDLKYKPLYSFAEAWALTIDWFKQNWLPKYKMTKEKINVKKDKMI
jgi:nucleoside-diphosphate-sugar epimerase